MMKYYIAKLLRIPRRFRMIYYIYFNRFKFWLNDVKFGRNMQVYTKLRLVMILSILMVMLLIHCVVIFVGVLTLHFPTLKFL